MVHRVLSSAEAFRSAVDDWFDDDSSDIDEPLHVALGITHDEWVRYLSSGGADVPASFTGSSSKS